MKSKIIEQGAEAKIFLDTSRKILTKNRLKKSYRINELDEKIRKRRTRSEIKLLKKASKLIPIPKVFETKTKNNISMEFIDGKKLSQYLDNFKPKEQKQICNQIGTSVAKLHQENIIHGDLTTSNMIYISDKKEFLIYFIDFGLGYFNGKYEDKAVDIHLFKQALEAKHFKNWKILFKEFKNSYAKIQPTESEKVFERLKTVEKRGRYKH